MNGILTSFLDNDDGTHIVEKDPVSVSLEAEACELVVVVGVHTVVLLFDNIRSRHDGSEHGVDTVHLLVGSVEGILEVDQTLWGEDIERHTVDLDLHLALKCAAVNNCSSLIDDADRLDGFEGVTRRSVGKHENRVLELSVSAGQLQVGGARRWVDISAAK